MSGKGRRPSAFGSKERLLALARKELGRVMMVGKERAGLRRRGERWRKARQRMRKRGTRVRRRGRRS